MKIGELAQRTGLAPSRIRFYERIGLLKAVEHLEALQAQLSQSKSQLLELMAQIQARPEDMDCAANARRVLSGMKLSQAEPGAATPAVAMKIRRQR